MIELKKIQTEDQLDTGLQCAADQRRLSREEAL